MGLPSSFCTPKSRFRSTTGVARVAITASLIAIGGMTSGCSSRLGQFKGSVSDISSGGDRQQTDLTALGKRYDARPGEKLASIAYGRALRSAGQFAQAVAVLERASIVNVGDREVAAAYGRALGDVGRFEEAMRVLSQAHLPDRPDWRVLSSQGVVADQMGQHARARQFYQQALQIRPDDPGVLTNLALSHVLTKDLAKAEELLKKAATKPDADPRVAANLALVRDLRAKTSASAQRGKPERKAPPAASRQTTRS